MERINSLGSIYTPEGEPIIRMTLDGYEGVSVFWLTSENVWRFAFYSDATSNGMPIYLSGGYAEQFAEV